MTNTPPASFTERDLKMAEVLQALGEYVRVSAGVRTGVVGPAIQAQQADVVIMSLLATYDPGLMQHYLTLSNGATLGADLPARGLMKYREQNEQPGPSVVPSPAGPQN